VVTLESPADVPNVGTAEGFVDRLPWTALGWTLFIGRVRREREGRGGERESGQLVPDRMLSSYSNSQPPLLEYYPAPLLPLDHWSCIEYCLGSLFSPFITGAVCSNLSYASSGSAGAQKVSRSTPASFSKRAKDPRSERSRTRDLPRESLAH